MHDTATGAELIDIDVLDERNSAPAFFYWPVSEGASNIFFTCMSARHD